MSGVTCLGVRLRQRGGHHDRVITLSTPSHPPLWGAAPSKHQHYQPMLHYCRTSVADFDPAIMQHWVDVVVTLVWPSSGPPSVILLSILAGQLSGHCLFDVWYCQFSDKNPRLRQIKFLHQLSAHSADSCFFLKQN